MNKEEVYKGAAEKLWGLLDDIDTLTDVIKPTSLQGYASFYRAAVKYAEQRHLILTSDGYSLFIPKPCAQKIVEEVILQLFHISFELFREFCKGRLFNTCRHPDNTHEGVSYSCDANLCPVNKEAKRRQANDLTTKVKTPAEKEPVPVGEICPWCNGDYLLVKTSVGVEPKVCHVCGQ